MVANLILGVVSVALIALLLGALTTGRIQYGAGYGAVIADRSKEPRSFWFIFAMEAGLVVFFLWLIFA